MDMELIKLEEDELQSMIEVRTEQDIGSKEFALLTNSIDRREDKLAKAYKVINEHEEKERERELNEKLKNAELDLKQKQFEAEVEAKNKDRELNEQLKKEELEQKQKQFEMEMEQKQKQFEMEMAAKNQQVKEEQEAKDRQHENELKVRKRTEIFKAVMIFAGVCVTAVGSYVVMKGNNAMQFENQMKWIPEIMNFEKTDSFSYEFAKALEQQITRPKR